jgi:hypothetical protein
MLGPVTEVTPLVNEHGESRPGGACFNELPDSGHIFGYAVSAPKRQRELTRQRNELGATMRGLVLEFCRDQNAAAVAATVVLPLAWRGSTARTGR